MALVGSPGVVTECKAGELSSNELAMIFICETMAMHLTNWLRGSLSAIAINSSVKLSAACRKSLAILSMIRSRFEDCSNSSFSVIAFEVAESA